MSGGKRNRLFSEKPNDSESHENSDRESVNAIKKQLDNPDKLREGGGKKGELEKDSKLWKSVYDVKHDLKDRKTQLKKVAKRKRDDYFRNHLIDPREFRADLDKIRTIRKEGSDLLHHRGHLDAKRKYVVEDANRLAQYYQKELSKTSLELGQKLGNLVRKERERFNAIEKRIETTKDLGQESPNAFGPSHALTLAKKVYEEVRSRNLRFDEAGKSNYWKLRDWNDRLEKGYLPIPQEVREELRRFLAVDERTKSRSNEDAKPSDQFLTDCHWARGIYDKVSVVNPKTGQLNCESRDYWKLREWNDRLEEQYPLTLKEAIKEQKRFQAIERHVLAQANEGKLSDQFYADYASAPEVCDKVVIQNPKGRGLMFSRECYWKLRKLNDKLEKQYSPTQEEVGEQLTKFYKLHGRVQGEQLSDQFQANYASAREIYNKVVIPADSGNKGYKCKGEDYWDLYRLNNKLNNMLKEQQKSAVGVGPYTTAQGRSSFGSEDWFGGVNFDDL